MRFVFFEGYFILSNYNRHFPGPSAESRATNCKKDCAEFVDVKYGINEIVANIVCVLHF